VSERLQAKIMPSWRIEANAKINREDTLPMALEKAIYKGKPKAKIFLPGDMVSDGMDVEFDPGDEE